ncbi:MAG: gamma-glutamylcyclotransferase [Pseudomonadota bacterium]
MTTLQTLVTPPDVSEMRLTLDRFEEFDAQAAAEGWPPGWRLEHDVREANRRSVLGDRLTDDLWVFAYGSLIWDPAVQVDEYRYGTLSGWSRKFCMRLETGRGSREQPGLMAALDEGDGCNGVVFRIQGPLVDRESEFMWRREMFAGAYRPEFLKVETPQGPVEALTFLMDHSNERYMPDISEGEAARMIAAAEGRLGPNFDYLDSLVRHLDELGIADDAMHRLHTRAAGIRASLV